MKHSKKFPLMITLMMMLCLMITSCGKQNANDNTVEGTKPLVSQETTPESSEKPQEIKKKPVLGESEFGLELLSDKVRESYFFGILPDAEDIEAVYNIQLNAGTRFNTHFRFQYSRNVEDLVEHFKKKLEQVKIIEQSDKHASLEGVFKDGRCTITVGRSVESYNQGELICDFYMDCSSGLEQGLDVDDLAGNVDQRLLPCTVKDTNGTYFAYHYDKTITHVAIWYMTELYEDAKALFKEPREGFADYQFRDEAPNTGGVTVNVDNRAGTGQLSIYITDTCDPAVGIEYFMSIQQK